MAVALFASCSSDSSNAKAIDSPVKLFEAAKSSLGCGDHGPARDDPQTKSEILGARCTASRYPVSFVVYPSKSVLQRTLNSWREEICPIRTGSSIVVGSNWVIAGPRISAVSAVVDDTGGRPLCDESSRSVPESEAAALYAKIRQLGCSGDYDVNQDGLYSCERTGASTVQWWFVNDLEGFFGRWVFGSDGERVQREEIEEVSDGAALSAPDAANWRYLVVGDGWVVEQVFADEVQQVIAATGGTAYRYQD